MAGATTPTVIAIAAITVFMFVSFPYSWRSVRCARGGQADGRHVQDNRARRAGHRSARRFIRSTRLKRQSRLLQGGSATRQAGTMSSILNQLLSVSDASCKRGSRGSTHLLAPYKAKYIGSAAWVA